MPRKTKYCILISLAILIIIVMFLIISGKCNHEALRSESNLYLHNDDLETLLLNNTWAIDVLNDKIKQNSYTQRTILGTMVYPKESNFSKEEKIIKFNKRSDGKWRLLEENYTNASRIQILIPEIIDKNTIKLKSDERILPVCYNNECTCGELKHEDSTPVDIKYHYIIKRNSDNINCRMYLEDKPYFESTMDVIFD